MNKTGGSAFPVCEVKNRNEETILYPESGMTLRDYFAAQAMQAMISTAGAPCLNGLDDYEPITAKASYKIADAMLKAREA